MEMEKIGNGSLKLPLNFWQYFTVWGGPYQNKPGIMVGVSMRESSKKDICTIGIPTPDFNVPSLGVLNHGLKVAVQEILDGQPLYVGCGAGFGRTGLFLAILAKAFKVDKPVEYVREHYIESAVETPRQYEFVLDYQIPTEVVDSIANSKWVCLAYFWKRNLTRVPKVN
jgi:hypothetical protein